MLITSITITERMMNMPEKVNNAELLAQVTAAIAAIATTGQSYTIGSRSLTRANLTELREMKKELEAQVASEGSNTGLFPNCYVAFFDGR